jgi:hypothetical protein
LHEITKKIKGNSKPNDNINNKSSLRHLSGMTSTLLSICLKTRQSETPGVVRERKKKEKKKFQGRDRAGGDVCVCMFGLKETSVVSLLLLLRT